MVPTNSSVKVEWSPPPGTIQLYKVTLSGGRKISKTRDHETTATSWIFKDLEPYTEYETTVTAKNVDHWGKKSSAKTVRTLEGGEKQLHISLKM